MLPKIADVKNWGGRAKTDPWESRIAVARERWEVAKAREEEAHAELVDIRRRAGSDGLQPFNPTTVQRFGPPVGDYVVVHTDAESSRQLGIFNSYLSMTAALGVNKAADVPQAITLSLIHI